MSPVLVVVTDGAKARFLTLEAATLPEFESSPQLIELENLSNPEQELSGQELWSGPQSQAGHYQEGKSLAHSYDDHRQDHRREYERRFVQAIATHVESLSPTDPAQQLLLVAEPHILGLLREVLLPRLPKTWQVRQLDKDLCHLNPQDLHQYLAEKDLLPPVQGAANLR